MNGVEIGGIIVASFFIVLMLLVILYVCNFPHSTISEDIAYLSSHYAVFRVLVQCCRWMPSICRCKLNHAKVGSAPQDTQQTAARKSKRSSRRSRQPETRSTMNSIWSAVSESSISRVASSTNPFSGKVYNSILVKQNADNSTTKDTSGTTNEPDNDKVVQFDANTLIGEKGDTRPSHVVSFS